MEQVSLAELCSAISLFTDLGTGQPAEHAMRTTLMGAITGDSPELITEIPHP